MAIIVSEKLQKVIDDRQKWKFEAIRKVAIFDKETMIPTENGEVRCLEYVPKNAGEEALPVVFDIHGGGFTNGYPEEDDYICRRLSDNLKVHVFSIDYRLAPKFPFPDGQMDCYNVVSYVHENAEKFNILPDQMVIQGHSAGGNYTAVACLRSVETGEFSFKGAILDYPPMDFVTSPWDKPILEGAIPPELSETFDACYSLPEQRGDFHVSPAKAPDEIIKNLPPTTIMTAEIDSLREEAEQYGLRLATAGVEVIMKRFLGVRHAFTIEYDDPASLDAYDMIEKSVKRYLNL